MELEGKVAIVTGAASGIGKDIADASSRRKARSVAIADLNQRRRRRDGARDRGRGRRRRSASRWTSPTRRRSNAGVATVVATFGGVDILVSNAGIQIVHPLEEFSFAEWKKMLAIHLDGAFLTTRACLPHMYAAGAAAASSTWARCIRRKRRC